MGLRTHKKILPNYSRSQVLAKAILYLTNNSRLREALQRKKLPGLWLSARGSDLTFVWCFPSAWVKLVRLVRLG